MMTTDNERHNFVNTFVRRFHKVKQYPILRFMLYIVGYYIIYMISQLIISTTYPYFSQHETIVPYLPSATFDKRLYHFVDTRVVDDSFVRQISTSDRNNADTFPCLIQNCQMEIERQQHANMALIHAERFYTKSRLARLSYWGYWSTFLDQYGETSIHPLFDTFRNRFYTENDDESDDDDDEDDDEYEDKDEDVKDPFATTLDQFAEHTSFTRNHTGTLVDFHSTPVYNNMGEVVFSLVSMTFGILLLRGYGFLFWQKY